MLGGKIIMVSNVDKKILPDTDIALCHSRFSCYSRFWLVAVETYRGQHYQQMWGHTPVTLCLEIECSSACFLRLVSTRSINAAGVIRNDMAREADTAVSKRSCCIMSVVKPFAPALCLKSREGSERLPVPSFEMWTPENNGTGCQGTWQKYVTWTQ